MGLDLKLDEVKSKMCGLLGKYTGSTKDIFVNKKSPSLNKKSKIHFVSSSVKFLEKILSKPLYEKESVLGVDITPHYIRVGQLSKKYGLWQLSNLASACMENQYRNIDLIMNPDSYVESLKDLLAKNKIKEKKVAFTVPTSSSIIKILSFTDMSDEEFQQAATLGSIWESAVMLEGDISEYSIYYKILRHNPAVIHPLEELPTDEELSVESFEGTFISAQEIPQAEMQSFEGMVVEEIPQAEMQSFEGMAVEEIPQAEMQSFEGMVVEEIPQAEMQSFEGMVVEEIPQAEMQSFEEMVVEEMPVSAETENEAENEEEKENKSGSDTMAEDEGAPLMESSALFSEGIYNNSSETDTSWNNVDGGFVDAAATMDVLFIATKYTNLDANINILKRAGLKPVVADVKCLALKNAIESNPKNFEEVREPYAFVEFGADENYIFVVDGNHTDIYNIYISEDDLDFLMHDSDDESKMQEFVQNYSSQALQILQDHQQNYRTDAIIHLFATTAAPLHVKDASSLPLMKSFIQKIKPLMTGRAILECDFCGHMKVPEKFAKKVNAEGNISAWASTVGISTRRLDVFDYEAAINTSPMSRSNLLPMYTQMKKNNIKAIASVMVGTAVSLLIFAVIAISFLSINNSAKNLTTDIAGMQVVETLYNEKLDYAQKLSIMLMQVSSLDEIQKNIPSNQYSILSAYEHTTNSIPEGVWLSGISYQEPNRIILEGMSLNDHNILSFVKRLNSNDKILKMSIKTMKTEIIKEIGNMPKDITIVPGSGEEISVKKFMLDGVVTAQYGNIIIDKLNKEVK